MVQYYVWFYVHMWYSASYDIMQHGAVPYAVLQMYAAHYRVWYHAMPKVLWYWVQYYHILY